MADSNFIKLRIEPAMRQALTELCNGANFQQRKMPIRWNGEGDGLFEFDAVSDDSSIIACLSTARNLKPGQRHKLMRDATFMWLVPNARRRIPLFCAERWDFFNQILPINLKPRMNADENGSPARLS